MSAEERDAARVGAYLLGLTTAAENRRIERELAEDDALKEVHAVLAERLQELADTATPVEPSSTLWSTIEERIDTPGPDAVPVGRAAHERQVGKSSSQPARKPANDGFWRGVATAAFVAALVGGLFLSHPDWRGFLQPEPRVIAVLFDADGEAGAIIEAFDGETVRIVPLRDFIVPPDRTLQVWTKPNETIGPVSLGVLPEARQRRLTGPDLPEPEAEQLYEVTLEPAPGSPTGRPTGPILLKGFAKTPL